MCQGRAQGNDAFGTQTAMPNEREDVKRQAPCLLLLGQRPRRHSRGSRSLSWTTLGAAAHGIFRDKDHTMAAVGGTKGLPSYEWMRNNSY